MQPNDPGSASPVPHAEELEQRLMDLLQRHRQDVEDVIVQKPHVALAVAAGIGFVLGGGLTPRRLFRLAIAVGTPLLSRRLYAEAGQVLAAERTGV